MAELMRYAQLVKGGKTIKQGEIFELAFQLFGSDNIITVPTVGQVINITIANNSGTVYETTAVVVDNKIQFTVSENIGYGQMRLEIKVTEGTTLIQKYPADGWIILNITKSLDDVGVGGINAVTATQMRSEITAIETSVGVALTDAADAKLIAERVETEFDQVVAEAGSSNPEIVLARMGETTLQAFNEKTTKQLAEFSISNYPRLETETDDTGRFQRALNDINAVGGGYLYLPDGNYIKDESIIYSNTSIIGASKSNTVITLKTGATGLLFICHGNSGAYKKNINFINLTIDGGGVSKDLLSFNYVGFTTIQNCVFTNFALNAILIKNTNGSVRADSVSIKNCLFYDSPGGSATGVRCEDWGEYVNISSCTFNRVQFGIRIQNAANTAVIDNLMINNGYAVYIWQSNNSINNGKTLIQGNRINHSYTTGIYANDMIRNADRGISIIGNHILLPNSSAIRLKGAYSSVISSNRIQMNLDTDNGIILENGTGISDYNMVIGNLITRGALQNLTTGTNNLIINNLANVPVS